jgi:uncharacterized protein
MKYNYIIVGAGPTGLFAAHELTKNKPQKVLIIEQGNPIEKRKKTETMTGVGGAGTFSDGKLHFTPVLSHEKLLDLFSVEEYQTYLDYVEKLFTEFGVKAPLTPQNDKKAKNLVKACHKKGIQLYLRKCKHVGSDVLPQVVKNITKKLENQGVEILFNTAINKIIVKNGKVQGVKNNKKIFTAEKYLLAPGRIGASWLQNQAKKIGIDYSYQKVEIGVRVEFPASIMEKHSKIMHENIYSFQTPTYDDVVRTFCPCPNGLVAIENYKDYVSVNGYSNSNGDSKNSNFNLTTEIQLTEPVENTLDYAISIAKTATIIGGRKPIIQRLADLRSGRRSTWERIKRSYVEPSLKKVTPGDISMALPHRLVTNTLEGLQILERVLPGINRGSTLLYAPEIKLRGNRIKINKKMQTEINNLFVAGDGAGASGNIVGAAISGIFAAKGMES